MDCYLSLLKGHSSDVNCLSYSDLLLASGSSDGTVRVWDCRSQKSVRRLTDPQFFPSGSVDNVVLKGFFLTASSGNSVHCFDIRNPSKILISASDWSISLPDDISQMSQKPSYLSLGLDSGGIIILNTDTQEVVTQIPAHENICSSSCFIGENLLISAGFDCKVILHDIAGGIVSELSLTEVFGSGGINPPHVYCMAHKEEEPEVAVGVGNGWICVFGARGKLVGIKNWEAHNERVMCCSYCGYNGMLVTACNRDFAVWTDGLVKRIALDEKVRFIQPNWVESSDSEFKVYIANTSNLINVYTFRE